jgi:hypothetical protein
MPTLDASQILDDRARQLGLEKFVDPELRQRFGTFVQWFNEFGTIEASKLPAAIEQFMQLVGNRLKLARDWAERPQILQSAITQPFFVIGNARSGTTLAQVILAMDDGHRTPQYWEVQHPSPPPGSDAAADMAAQRVARTYVQWILATSPQLLPAHPYLEQLECTEAEDEYLYVLDFHMAYPLSLLKVPNLPQALPPVDPVAALRFHKRVLQQLQWRCPTKRWVGKGIVHQYIAPAVLEVYPDAVCFWIHRAPEDYIPSLLELLEVQYKPFNGGLYRVDAADMVKQLRAGVEFILNSEVINDPRIHHIRFSDFVADPAAAIADVYAQRGIPFSERYRARIVAFIHDPKNRSDRHGKFAYDPEKFGISRAQLRAQFKDYCERFGV